MSCNCSVHCLILNSGSRIMYRFAIGGTQMVTMLDSVQGGVAAQLLCASVGSYTAEYRDDTDNRSGGCRMSWMLSIPTDAPEWLCYVQLCYIWYPDGDGGQGRGQKF